MTDEIPKTSVKPARRSLFDRLSVVWIIPVAALVIALGIAWNSYHERGALIEIQFQNASGITAGQTEVRYREIPVGLVEKVNFSDDLSHVIAHVRIDKEVEPFVDSEAAFWVVRPQVTTQGVTGLDTVLNGVYIEGSWDETPLGLQRVHVGLDDPPLARPDQPGSQILLLASDERGLREGSPVLFKGLEVGKVGRPRLSPDGVSIEAPAFIFAPHDQLMTTRSRFWDASGVSFKLGAGGASVNFDSLTSLINGGVIFETVVSGGDAVAKDATFTVYPDQDTARSSLFERDSSGKTQQIAVVFEENVTGLTVGAPVTLRGLDIGEVASVTGRVDEKQFGDDRVRLIVILSIGMDALQLGDQTDETAILDFFDNAVAEGWRARLTRASILTGGLKIEFVQVPDAAPATFLRDAQPYPIVPSAEADLPPMSATAEGLMKRVNDLPVESLLQSAIQFIEGATDLVKSDDIQRIPADLRGTIDDIRTVIGSADLQAVPRELSKVMEGVTTAVDEVTSLFTDLNRNGSADRLVAAVEAAGAAAQSVTDTMDLAPQLLEKIGAVADKAAAMELDSLVEQVTGLVTSADELISTEGARQLPASLSLAMDEVGAALAELRAGGTVSSVNQTLAAAEEAAQSVASASDDLPGLVARTEAVLREAERALASVSETGDLNRDTRATLNEVRRAAESVRSLARTIERNPNALLTGSR